MSNLVDSRLDPQISNPQLAYVPARNLFLKGQQIHLSLSGNAHTPAVISMPIDINTGACEAQLDAPTAEHPASGRWSTTTKYDFAGTRLPYTWHYLDEG